MTDQPTALGYAVIQEQEGEYAPPDPSRTFSVDEYGALDLARAIAEGLNERDAEGVSRWHVVALVPIAP